MADIFVSYSRKDLDRVRVLAHALAAQGWSVWWDRHIPAGRTFDEVIAEALADARCVLVVWSKESIASDWVREEAEEGRRREILVPVLFDEGRPPLGFGRIQAVDLRDWNGAPSAEGFQRLVADITAMIGPPRLQRVAAVASPALDAPSIPAGVESPRDAAATVSAVDHGRKRRVFVRPSREVALSVGALVLVLIVAVGLYRWRTAGGSSQPAPVMGASAEPALRLNAVLNEGGKPLETQVAYEVHEAVTDAEGNRKRISTSSVYQGPPRFALAPGRYYVTAIYGSASASTEVEVAAATLTIQTLNLRAGVLALSSVLTPGSAPLQTNVKYEVYEAVADIEGNRKRVTGSAEYEGPPRLPLPAGRYYLTATHGSATANSEIDIRAGEIKPYTVNLNAGVLLLSSTLAAGTPALEKDVSYDVYEAAKDVEGNRKRVVGSPSYTGPPRLPLSAGRYYVGAAYGSASADMELELQAGEIKRQVMNLRAGILSLSSQLAGSSSPLGTGVTYEVYQAAKDVEGRRTRVTGSAAYLGPPRLPLPAGRYYVTAASEGAKGEAEVTVSEGEVHPVRLTLDGR